MGCRTCGGPLDPGAERCPRCATPVAPPAAGDPVGGAPAAGPPGDGGWVAPGPPPGGPAPAAPPTAPVGPWTPPDPTAPGPWSGPVDQPGPPATPWASPTAPSGSTPGPGAGAAGPAGPGPSPWSPGGDPTGAASGPEPGRWTGPTDPNRPASGRWAPGIDANGPPSGQWSSPGDPNGSSSGSWASPSDPTGPPSGAWVPPGGPATGSWAPAPGAPAGWDTSGAWGPPGGPPPTWGAAPGGPPPPPSPQSRRARRIGVVVAAVGVLALLGVSALAVQALVGGGSGADSPEAAVDRLAEAVTAEDPVAVAAALDPAEAESLGALVEDLEEHAQSNGFAPSGDTFAGIDLTAEDLEYEVDELGGGLARVEVVGGEVGYAFDPDQLGEETRTILGEDAERSSDRIDVDDVDGDPLRLVTVRRDGGWYVSVVHTLADWAVEGLDLPSADGDEELDRSDPAPDPETAVTAFVEAVVDGDVEGMAGHLAGDIGSVLRPYRDAVEDVLGQGSFAVDDVEVEDAGELDDGGRRVRIVGAEGSFEIDGEEIGWELDGLCVRFDGFDEYFEQQYDEYEDEYLYEDGPFGGMFFDAMAEELCAMVEGSFVGEAMGEGLSVVVVEDRGGWAVSPVDTVALAIRDLLPGLDRDALVALAGRPDLVTPEGEAPIGEVFEVDLGDHGAATRTLTAPRDMELVVGVEEEDAYAYVVGPDGEEPDYGEEGSVLEEGVEYRLVVQGYGYGSGAGIVPVGLGEVVSEDAGEVSLAGTFTGTLTTAEPVRRTSFTVDREVRAEVVLDGDVNVDVFEEGEPVCDDGDSCRFEPGTDYEIVLRGDYGEVIDAEREYEVGFDVAPPPVPGAADDATIDGATSVSGELSGEGDTVWHQIVVPEGASVIVTIEADEAGEDIDAFLSEGEHTDSGDEGFVLDGPIDEEIEVYLYSEGPTGYTITLEPA
jgi:hypothetical protein